MKHERYDIAVNDLRQLLSYDPDSGVLTWLERPIQFCKNNADRKRWNSRCANKPVKLTPGRDGYLCFKLLDVVYRSHRVAWALHHGEWPPIDMHIDHLNHDVTDNSIRNMRLATPLQNRFNQRKVRGKTSCFKGVFWDARRSKWCSKIKKNGRHILIGCFDNELIAYEAYCRVAREYHGDFFSP